MGFFVGYMGVKVNVSLGFGKGFKLIGERISLQSKNVEILKCSLSYHRRW